MSPPQLDRRFQTDARRSRDHRGRSLPSNARREPTMAMIMAMVDHLIPQDASERQRHNPDSSHR